MGFSPASGTEPADALKTYFKAIDDGDKELLRESIDAPKPYADQFVRVIDVWSRLSALDDLLVVKYGITEGDRTSPLSYLKGLDEGLLTQKFRINGNRAESIPRDKNEIPAHFILINGKWRLDMRRGQNDENLKRQAVLLRESFDAMIALLNGFLVKIDTLDTAKHSYENAWKMVEIQIDRKLSALAKDNAKENEGSSPSKEPVKD